METKASPRVADDRIPLTAAGRRQIENEIARVEAQVAELRDLVAEAHEDRTADEDERAAALAMVDEIGRLEARLVELRAILERAVDAAPAKAEVAGIGTTVRVVDPDGEELTYTLVNPAEAAPSLGPDTTGAPLGQALVGHKPGDVVTVNAPSGAWDLRILDIGLAA